MPHILFVQNIIDGLITNPMLNMLKVDLCQNLFKLLPDFKLVFCDIRTVLLILIIQLELKFFHLFQIVKGAADEKTNELNLVDLGPNFNKLKAEFGQSSPDGSLYTLFQHFYNIALQENPSIDV